jgi:Ras-related protein Rab-11A|eukprot:g1617.t1
MDLPDSIADKFTADEIREYVEQFKEVDDDGSGFLDPEEIGQLLKSLGNDKWDDDEYIKQLIEAVDEDNDGQVNMEEFFLMMDGATSDLSGLVAKQVATNAQAHDRNVAKKKRKKSLSARMFKTAEGELSKGDRTITLNASAMDSSAMALASTFDKETTVSYAEKNGHEELYRKDHTEPFEQRHLRVYLMDGDFFEILLTEKSKVKHAMVQLKNQMDLKHDSDMAIYVMYNGQLQQALEDEEELFGLLDSLEPGRHDLVYRRRTYLPWSPLNSEARDAIDVDNGAHRISFVEAQKRFLGSDYPTKLGEAVELAAILASCAQEDPNETFIFNNLASFLPNAIRNGAVGDQKTHLAHRIYMQGKRKDFYGGFSAIEIERSFLEKCAQYYSEMYGDTFFHCKVVERDPGSDVTTEHIQKQPKVVCHVGIGHEGIHKVFPDGRVGHISFTDIVRWLVPSGQDIFAVWTEDEVTFMFTDKCEEIQGVLNRYIREFLAARDTPGKMAYPVRVITEEDIRGTFDEFDADGGGTLDQSEIAEFVATFGMTLSTKEKDEMFEMIDQNGDGEIQFEEFLPWWKTREEADVQARDPDAPAASDDGHLSILDSEVRKKKKEGEHLEACAARLLKDRFTTFKGILLGSSNVGKTNLVYRLAGKNFSETHNPTLETEYHTVALKIEHEEDVRWIKVEVWDTAGQEKYNALMKSYYRGAKAGAAVLVYDVNEEKSLKDIERLWLPNLLKQTPAGDTHLILVANKCDTLEEDISAGEEFASDQYDEIHADCVRASAKNDKGVREAFASVFSEVYGYVKSEQEKGVQVKFNEIKLGALAEAKKSGGGCC